MTCVCVFVLLCQVEPPLLISAFFRCVFAMLRTYLPHPSTQESWWSYDVCFGPPQVMSPNELKEFQKAKRSNPEGSQPDTFTSGARQYRMSTVVSQSGKVVRQSQVGW